MTRLCNLTYELEKARLVEPYLPATRMDWRDGLAGAISGVTTRCVVAPLDVIKIRLQLQASSAARFDAPCPVCAADVRG